MWMQTSCAVMESQSLKCKSGYTVMAKKSGGVFLPTACFAPCNIPLALFLQECRRVSLPHCPLCPMHCSSGTVVFRNLEPRFPVVPCCWAPLVVARPCWQEQWPQRPKFPSLLWLARSLWKCWVVSCLLFKWSMSVSRLLLFLDCKVIFSPLLHFDPCMVYLLAPCL